MGNSGRAVRVAPKDRMVEGGRRGANFAQKGEKRCAVGVEVKRVEEYAGTERGDARGKSGGSCFPQSPDQGKKVGDKSAKGGDKSANSVISIESSVKK